MMKKPFSEDPFKVKRASAEESSISAAPGVCSLKIYLSGIASVHPSPCKSADSRCWFSLIFPFFCSTGKTALDVSKIVWKEKVPFVQNSMRFPFFFAAPSAWKVASGLIRFLLFNKVDTQFGYEGGRWETRNFPNPPKSWCIGKKHEVPHKMTQPALTWNTWMYVMPPSPCSGFLWWKNAQEFQSDRLYLAF